jgi:hypothetical protein
MRTAELEDHECILDCNSDGADLARCRDIFSFGLEDDYGEESFA